MNAKNRGATRNIDTKTINPHPSDTFNMNESETTTPIWEPGTRIPWIEERFANPLQINTLNWPENIRNEANNAIRLAATQHPTEWAKTFTRHAPNLNQGKIRYILDHIAPRIIDIHALIAPSRRLNITTPPLGPLATLSTTGRNLTNPTPHNLNCRHATSDPETLPAENVITQPDGTPKTIHECHTCPGPQTQWFTPEQLEHATAIILIHEHLLNPHPTHTLNPEQLPPDLATWYLINIAARN